MRAECMGTPEVWDTMADMVRLGRVMRGCIMNIGEHNYGGTT